jgi:hypothetical protein
MDDPEGNEFGGLDLPPLTRRARRSCGEKQLQGVLD